MEGKFRFQANTLKAKINEKTTLALASGSLQSIPTDYEFVQQGKVNFIVRILANLVCKESTKQTQKQNTHHPGQQTDPFLPPYDEALFVSDISDTHICLLNKFNVVDHHILIVTRHFEEQTSLLNREDFEALWVCMSELNGFAFYNGGKTAGASQRHKHLQLVPLPLAPLGPPVPIETLFASVNQVEPFSHLPNLPFRHGFTRLDPKLSQTPKEAAKILLQRYHELLQAVNLLPQTPDHNQSGPYNLLMTRDWMLVVPRSQEHFKTISINALGFAGALLVRNTSEMALIKQQGPMTVLSHVGIGK
jgi:ATP adenylyltransferase